MQISCKTFHKTSDVVGEVEITILKSSDPFFGGTIKRIKMVYKKNDKQVTRTFDTDECGRIKFTNACEKIGIAADGILAQIYY